MAEKTIDNDAEESVLYEDVERVKIHKGAEDMLSSGTNNSHSGSILSPANPETELLQKLQESLDAMNALTQEVRKTNEISSKNTEISNRLSCAVYILTAGLFLLTIINIGVVVASSVFPAESAELINVSLNLLDLTISVGILFVLLVAIFFVIKWGFDICEWLKKHKKRNSSS